MSAWIISICGVALLTVLVDVIVPDGNTKKYVRSVIGVVLTFTMLLPISGLFSGISNSTANFKNNIDIQQPFIQGLADQNELARVQKVAEIISSYQTSQCSVHLQQNGYVCVRVRCDRTTLSMLQRDLSAVENKIIVVWSESSG